MFEYSSDSLTDYVYSFPTTPVNPTPIVLEYTMDSTIPTTPTQKQMQSIQKGELPALSTRITSPSSSASLQKTRTSDPGSGSGSDPESPKLPFITNVYIASITVVGLFLLFRMIQK